MTRENEMEAEIGVTSSEARRLAAIADVLTLKTRQVVLMKHNQPVAVIVPIQGQRGEFWGSLQGTVKIVSGTDLTAPTGEVWDVDD